MSLQPHLVSIWLWKLVNGLNKFYSSILVTTSKKVFKTFLLDLRSFKLNLLLDNKTREAGLVQRKNLSPLITTIQGVFAMIHSVPPIMEETSYPTGWKFSRKCLHLAAFMFPLTARLNPPTLPRHLRRSR